MSGAQLVAVGFGAAFAATGVGAPVGFLIGSMVGNLLFPPKDIVSQGPRLGDLRVSSSSYGAPRAIGYGTIRQAGNMIWSSGIIEKKKTTKTSGKGGSMMGAPAQKSVTYSYYASFAMAFGEGPADDVLRIWADSKIIFDKRSTELNTRKFGLNFRFYPGDEEQLPDASIIAKEGADNTPAFRGTVMIVFDTLPLSDFGNRIPNITAEIAYSSTPNKMVRLSTDIAGATFTGWQFDDFMIDWERGYCYTTAVNSSVSQTAQALRKFRLSDLQEVQQITSLDAFAITGDWNTFLGDGGIVLPNGDLVMCTNSLTSGNSKPIVRFNGNTLTEKARFGVGSSTLNNRVTEFETVTKWATISLFGFLGREDYVLTGSVFNSLGILNVTSGEQIDHLWNSDIFASGVVTDARVINVCNGKISEGQGDGYALTGSVYGSPDTTDLHIYRLRVTSGAAFSIVGGVNIVTGVEFDLVLTITVDDLFPGKTTLTKAGGILYDETDDTVMFYAQENSLNETRWFKYNQETGTQVWRSEPVSLVPNDSRWGGMNRVQDGTFGYVIGDNAVLINTQDGTLIQDSDSPAYSSGVANGLGGWDSRTETFVGPSSGSGSKAISQFFFRRRAAQEVSVGTIVKDIASRVGLPNADLDTTGIDSLTVPGYLIGRQTSARAAIIPLAQTFFFDGVESDDQLKFIARGGASVRTILQRDLAALSDQNDIIKVSRGQEVELPERFSLVYLDKDKDYNQNAHHAKRIQEPSPAMRSDNELGIDFPGALSATFAKQSVEKALYMAWTERNNYQIKLPWSHLDLDAGDVVTILLDNGISFRGRVAQADAGANLEIEMTLIGEDSNQFVSTVLGDSGSGVPAQSVRSSNYVFTKIMDMPLLRDADEVAGRASNPLYAAMGSSQSGSFLAGTLLKSEDNQVYDDVQFFVSEMNWGNTLNVLGDPAGPHALWGPDETNTLTVRLNAGEADMATITDAQLLNYGNPAAILKTNGEIEIIQYRDVTANADGTFTLSYLLRGRRGTDTMATGHGRGEIFVMLVPGDLEKVILTLGERNQLRYYKSVGAGQLIENGELQTLTSLHRALMPYKPAQVKAAPGTSNSIDFSWVRRTRVGGELQDGFGVVPISEDSEEYELDIYDGPGGSIVRSVTGLSTPAYNYSSANQTTDGFTPPLSSVTIRIYQISAQVGRGFSKEETLNVE